jgi:peroxiredoxin
MMGTGRHYIFASIATVICCIGIMCSGCCAVEVTAKEGAQAPDFSLSTIDGDTLTLSNLRGQPVVLTFWNTQCGWCLYQMPFLQAAHEQMGQDITIVAIDIGESSSLIQQFADYFGYTFTFALDYYGSVMNQYNIVGTPTTFLVDGNGIIQAIKIGAYIDEYELLEALEDL